MVYKGKHILTAARKQRPETSESSLYCVETENDVDVLDWLPHANAIGVVWAFKKFELQGKKI